MKTRFRTLKRLGPLLAGLVACACWFTVKGQMQIETPNISWVEESLSHQELYAPGSVLILRGLHLANGSRLHRQGIGRLRWEAQE